MSTMSSETKIWEGLESHGSDFRVFHLHAGGYDSPIVGHLENVSRGEKPEYAALSYTCAPADNEQEITISGNRLSISSNCASALRHIRHESDILTIWVDSICIKQTDNNERSTQVAQMHQIYRSASRVIVWLGEENTETTIALDLIDEISTIGTYDPTTATSGNLGSPEAWKAFDRLFERPWFERIWIVQEISLAKEIIFRCGRFELEWTTFTRAVQWRAKDNTHIKRNILPVQSLFPNAVQLRNEWAARNFANSRDKPLQDLLAQFGHWKASDKLDKINALLGMSKEKTVLSLQPDYTKSIREIYRNVVKYIITRDRRLDILRQCQNPPMYKGLPSWVPDWTADFPYRAAMSEKYRPKGDGQVMLGPNGEIMIPASLTMPENAYGSWQQESMVREEKNFAASLDLLAESYFPTTEEIDDLTFGCTRGPTPEAEDTMMLKGIHVDTIHSVTMPLFRPRTDLEDPVFILEWEKFALFQSPSNIDCPYGGTFEGRLDSYWRTISTDRVWQERGNLRAPASCRNLFEQWRAKLMRDANPSDAHVPDTIANIDLNDDSARWRAAYNLLAKMNISDADPNAEQTSTLLTDYQTWQNHISNVTIPNNLPTYINGLREEFTATSFANTMEKYCFARKLARTTSGRLALVPEHTRPNDLVFIMYGASVPYIVRPKQNRYKLDGWTRDIEGLRGPPGQIHPGTMSFLYSFVGEAYVHGIMDGEALNYPDIERVTRLRRVPVTFEVDGADGQTESKTMEVIKEVEDPLTQEQEYYVSQWKYNLKQREREVWFDSTATEFH